VSPKEQYLRSNSSSSAVLVGVSMLAFIGYRLQGTGYRGQGTLPRGLSPCNL
jgi:hypothetical protein